MNFVFTGLFLWVIEHDYDLSTGVSENFVSNCGWICFWGCEVCGFDCTKKQLSETILLRDQCEKKCNKFSAAVKIIKVKKFVFVILKCKMIAKLHITCSVFNPAA